MTAGQLAALLDEVVPLPARLVEVVGLFDRLDRAYVDALVAQYAARFVDVVVLASALRGAFLRSP